MKRFLIGCAVFLFLTVVGTMAWRLWPQGNAFYTDADSIKEPVATAPTRDVLWQPPTALADLINTAVDDYEPRMSSDGLTLFFVRGKAGHNADIYSSKRTHDGWTDPEPLTEINSEEDDLGPEPSADGASLYFYSNREGGLGGYDLWVARRGLNGWQSPTNLGPTVNSPYNDYGPALTADGIILYFSSNRPQSQDIDAPNPNAWPATLREDFIHRTYDLYSAGLSDRGVAEADAVTSLNTPFNEGAPAVSPFGDFIYFASDRPGGHGGFDLYRSRRLHGEHQPATNIGAAVNTTANELDPALAMGGYSLFFSSDRAVDRTSADGEERKSAPDEYNLYQTTSREVFAEVETLARPPIDWAAIWSLVGPNLLWALLALLLLLTMLALFKSAQDRRLSLLTKCLLASLAAHLLLMIVFNVWKVASSVAGELTGRRRGPIQIALANPGGDNSLSMQIRGPLTGEQTPPPVQELTSIRSEMAHEVQVERRTWENPVERSDISFPDRIEEWSPPSDARFVRLLAALPAPKLDVPAPPSLEMEAALPEANSPIRNEEPQPSTANSIEKLPHVARSRLVTPTVAEDYAGVRTALDPVSTNTGAALSAARSLVEEVSPNDAAPQAAPGFNAPLPTITVVQSYAPGAAAMPSLTLPAIAAGVAHKQEESRKHIADRTLPPPRAESTTLAGIPTGTTSVSLPPQPSTTSLLSAAKESSLASEVMNAGTEAVPQPLKSNALGSQINAAAMHAAVAALALPDLEASRTTSNAVSANSVESSEDQPRIPSLSIETSRARLSDFSADLTPAPLFESAMGTSSDRPRSDEPSFGVLIASTAHRDSPPARIENVPPLPQVTVASATVSPARGLELLLPKEEMPPEDSYQQRTSERRMDIVEQMGGSKETESAVELALNWLAAHQSRDGRWSAAGFDQGCGQCGGETHIEADHALTGLSLLCFLGAGHTHEQAGPYKNNVERGLQWLVSRQKADGDLRGKETMYSQGIATIALSEAFAMTGDRQLHDPVAKAAAYIQRAQNTGVGGWRYDPGQPGDTSVLGWQVMALKSASNAGVDVSLESFDAARAWLDRVSERSRPGLYAYQPGDRPKASMTAEGMFSQSLLGLPPTHRRMRDSADFILRHLPHWESDPATYFWYYASLALFQHQGKEWEVWNKALTEELTTHQREDGRAAGSWDPADEWSKIGGRIYQTALCTLMLEVYYRYLPLYIIDSSTVQTSANSDEPRSIGTIRGVVTDAATRRRLGDAAVRLDLPDRSPVTAHTEPDGTYMLDAPDVPDNFALSASQKGFVPKSINVERARLQGRTITVDFSLETASDAVLVTEAVPDVHHLGDDRFEGAINSQFQKKSEGAEFAVEFELPSDSASAQFSRAEVHLLAKGVQRNHRVVINGTTLKERLNQAPDDGSFGEFVAPFDARLLQPGTNELRIIAAPSDSDIDDFEFVNVQVRLSP